MESETANDTGKKPAKDPVNGPMNPSGWTDPAYRGRTIHFEQDEAGHEYVFKFPSYGHMSRFTRETMEDGAGKSSRNLVFGCLLYPTRSEVEERLEEKPGLVIALQNAINKETGLGEKFTRKN